MWDNLIKFSSQGVALSCYRKQRSRHLRLRRGGVSRLGGDEKGLRHVAQPWGFIVSLTEPAGWLWGSQVIACRGYPGPEPRRW